MLLQLEGCLGVYVCCLIHLFLMSTIYEKLIMSAFLWVSIISDSSFVLLVRQSLHYYVFIFAGEYAQFWEKEAPAFCIKLPDVFSVTWFALSGRPPGSLCVRTNESRRQRQAHPTPRDRRCQNNESGLAEHSQHQPSEAKHRSQHVDQSTQSSAG